MPITIFSSSPDRTESVSRQGKRLPRLTRVDAAKLPSFRITDRDRAILNAIGRCRILTAKHVEALFFASASGRGTNTSYCQYRLQQLYHRGYLARDEQPQKLSEGRKPLLYALDRAGARTLAETVNPAAERPSRPGRAAAFSPLFLDHLLATNDVLIAFTLAARRAGMSISAWADELNLRKRHATDRVTITGPGDRTKDTAVVPDGYFTLKVGEKTQHFFLEIDRGTMTGERSVWGKKDWARKITGYLAYYHTGLFRRRYHTKSLRVLTVTSSAKRLENLLAITEKTGGKARFWFTTFDHLASGTALTSPIWRVASRSGLHPVIAR